MVKRFGILVAVCFSFFAMAGVSFAQSTPNSTSVKLYVGLNWLYGQRKGCEKVGMPDWTWYVRIGDRQSGCLKSLSDDMDDPGGVFFPPMAPAHDRGQNWYWYVGGALPFYTNQIITIPNNATEGVVNFNNGILAAITLAFENEKKSRCSKEDKDDCVFENPEGSQEAKWINFNTLTPFVLNNNKDYEFAGGRYKMSLDIRWELEQVSIRKPVVKAMTGNPIYFANGVSTEISPVGACGTQDTIILECGKAFTGAPVEYVWERRSLFINSNNWEVIGTTSDNKLKYVPPEVNSTVPFYFRVRPHYYTIGKWANQYSEETNIEVSPKRPIVKDNFYTLTRPSCFNYNDGVLLIKVDSIQSSSPTFNYNLEMRDVAYGKSSGSGISTDYPFTSVTAGSFSSVQYKIQIINDNGKCATEKTITVTQPQKLLIDTLLLKYTNTHISCFDSSNGRVQVSAIGGTLPYRFYVNEFPLGNELALTSTSDKAYQFNNLKAGTRYDFQVTDANSCPSYELKTPSKLSNFSNVYLSKPSPIRDTVYAREYLKEPLQKPHNVSCFNYDNGELYTQIIKDSTELLNPPYRLWVQGRTDYGVTPFGADFNTPVYVTPAGKLKKGFYTVHIRDANNCPHTDTITLYEPEKLVLTKTDSSMIKCYGQPDGMMALKANGGTKTYTFYKDAFNNGMPPATSPVQTVLSDSTARYTNLIAGPPQYHLFYVSDLNGCRDSVRFNLPEPAPLDVKLDVSNIVCYNEQNGVLTAVVKGGTGAYTYQWSDGTVIAGATASQLGSLGPITYTVTVRDVNLCQASAGYTLVNPQPIRASLRELTPLSCADRSDASITIDSIQGGWTGYQYTKDGQNYITDPFFANLSAGVYSHLAIKDANGCIRKLDTIEIKKPKALTAAVEENNGVNCFGNTDAEILIKVAAGKKPYTLQFNGQTKTGSDSLYRFTGLASGNYILSVSDANQCSFGKEIYVPTPGRLLDTILYVSKATNGLNDGAATVSAIGGTAPYNYTWLLPEQAPPNDQKNIRSEYDPVTVGNLWADLYHVNITDAKGCAHTAYVGVSNLFGPSIDAVTVTSPLCHNTSDGSVSINASTANPPLTYYWPALNDSDNYIDQLPGGSYDVKITDASGNVTTRRVYVNAPAPLFIQMVTYPSTCYGQCDGIIEANLSGGTQPYVYSWSDPQAQSAYKAINLCEGSYEVAVVDAHTCSTVATAHLINPAKVDPKLGESATLCSGQMMTLDAGYEGSSYLWTSSFGFLASSQIIQTRIPGTYYLTVVDPYGCMGKDTFLLETSVTALNAEFVEPTKNYAGETVVFSEISWPRPESVQWILGSPDSVEVINETAFLKKVIYRYPGTYTVRLIASLGECRDTMDKVIKIFAPGDVQGYNNGRISLREIEELSLYPNPNNGKFTASVQLNKEASVTFTVLDVYGNRLKEVNKAGSLQYDVAIELGQLAAGIYSLRVSSEEDTRSVMFTIQY